MKDKYPYYVPVQFSGGMLTKLYKNKKFDDHVQCINAINALLDKKSFLKNYQFLVLEYTGQYESNILYIISDKKTIFVKSPTNNFTNE